MTEAVWDGEGLGEFADPKKAESVVALADLMSEISERCYAARWMRDTEYVLWDALAKGPRDWGRDQITADDLARLKRLSEASGGWITNSFDRAARFVSLDEFAQLVDRRRLSEP